MGRLKFETAGSVWEAESIVTEAQGVLCGGVCTGFGWQGRRELDHFRLSGPQGCM